MPYPAEIERSNRVRTALRNTILPRLRVGEPMPPLAPICRALGLSSSQVSKYMSRVLRDHGVVTTISRGRKIVVGLRDE